jgi:hypothetical protein
MLSAPRPACLGFSTSVASRIAPAQVPKVGFRRTNCFSFSNPSSPSNFRNVPDSPPGITKPSIASSCSGFLTKTTSAPSSSSRRRWASKSPCRASTPILGEVRIPEVIEPQATASELILTDGGDHIPLPHPRDHVSFASRISSPCERNERSLKLKQHKRCFCNPGVSEKRGSADLPSGIALERGTDPARTFCGRMNLARTARITSTGRWWRQQADVQDLRAYSMLGDNRLRTLTLVTRAETDRSQMRCGLTGLDCGLA